MSFLWHPARIRDLSDYPRPWFYRPEIYYGFYHLPAGVVHPDAALAVAQGRGFLGIIMGGVAWFFMIASVVLSVRWVQEGGVLNLFIFVPGVLLTLLTQVQWAAHRAQSRPAADGTEGPPQSAEARSAGGSPPDGDDTGGEGAGGGNGSPKKNGPVAST